MTAPSQSIELDEVERALRLLTEPGQTFEIRVLGEDRGRPWTKSGYFRDPAVAARSIPAVERRAKGVYFTINPVKPTLFAKRANRLDDVGKGGTTSDQHILRRTRLLIDVDPERDSQISSTDEERDAALQLISEIAFELHQRGWPEPVRADSGNGGHLVYGIDLPADDDSLVRRVLEKLAELFNGEVAGVPLKVDRTVFNPARISKIYGTVSRKGDEVDGRDHRTSRIISAPSELLPVTREQLEALAGPMPAKATRTESKSSSGTMQTLDLASWLSRYGIAVKGTHPNKEGSGTVYELEVCPFNSEHDRGEVCVIQMASGALSFKCHHNSCSWTWSDLRARFEGTREERIERARAERRATSPSFTVIDGGNAPSPKAAEPEPGTFDHALAVALAEVRAALARGGPKSDRKPLFSVDAVDILDKQYAETAWLVTGLITKGGIVMIGGEPKTTKTWLATEIAIAIATGTKVCGEFFATAGTAAYFYAEDLERQVRNRTRALMRGQNRRIARGRFHLCPRGQFLDITRDEDLAWLVASARELGDLDLLMLDPFRDISSAAEDKSDEMGPLMKRLRVLGELVGCTVGVVHHLGKTTEVSAKRRPGQRMRGSGAIHGSTDSGLYLTDSESDSPTVFKNTLDSEIKGARSAGTVEITLALVDDEHGEAVDARWEIERFSKKDREEEAKQAKEDAKNGKLRVAIVKAIRSMKGGAAPSASAIYALVGGNKSAVLALIREMHDRELAYTEDGITVRPEVPP